MSNMGVCPNLVVITETKEELDKLFNDHFMKKHTNFQCFEEFTFSSAVFINWQKEPIAENRSAFDSAVRGCTKFDNWNAFYKTAKSELEEMGE